MRSALACLLAVLAVTAAGCGGKKHSASSTTTTATESTSTTAATTSTTTKATAAPNGEASKTPTAIISDVRTAVGAATSVHVSGDGSTAGTKLTIDVVYDNAKSEGSGHISVNGVGFDIVHAGGLTYFRGSAAFLSEFATKAVAQKLAGKWFSVSPTDPQFASLAALTNLSALTTAILSTTGPFTKSSAKSFNGQPAVGIVDNGNGGTLWVATTGPALPLAIVPAGGSGKGNGEIAFDDWNAAVSIKAPAGAVTYDSVATKK